MKVKKDDTAAHTATPSTKPVSKGQIGKLADNLSERISKNAEEIPSEVFQQILGDESLIEEMYQSVFRRVQAITKVVVIRMGIVKPTGPTTVQEAVKAGRYDDHYRYLENEVNAKIFANWPKDLPEREIFIGLIPDGEFIPKRGVEEYWAERGYYIPEHADAYLQQLMCDIPENKMPTQLSDKYLVAYTPEASFRDEDGAPCCLFVFRNGGRRRLYMVFGHDDWYGRWGFILCKKPSAPEA